ncbi:MAG TPA: YraN family protein [Patescibacteria group bacterium]|jgi:putative endonuclease|nr:YraN family protein [Patescibacteria group bacterium]
MTFSFRKNLGTWGEYIACEEYLKRGYVLVARNVYNNKGKQMGEIDLIMRSETELIFVEVKTRSSNRFGTGAESVTKAKQKKLIRVLSWFCRKFPQYNNLKQRIDVCVVEPASLDKSAANVIIIPDAITLDY